MKHLSNYITECLDNDNIFFLLDTFFRNNNEAESQFYGIIAEFMKTKIVTTDKLKQLIKGTFLETELENFINLICNDVSLLKTNKTDIDYIYQLKKLIEYLISNKSTQNKWIKLENMNIAESLETVDGKLVRNISKHIVLTQEHDDEMNCSYVIIFKDKKPVGIVPDYDNNIMNITAVEAKDLIKDYVKK